MYKQPQDQFLSPLKPTEYAKYQNFAPTLSHELRTDPQAWSLYDDIDSLFDIGPVAYHHYGPQSLTSQTFMAQKCAGNFDESCEFLACDKTIIESNVGKVMATQFTSCPNGTTIGDALVGNSSQRRFCDLGQCTNIPELFNPLDPSSPVINKIVCGEQTDIVCRPPSNPDQDILLNKVLDRPDMHVDILLNMHRNSKNDRDKFVGTRIGRLFEIIDAYYKIKN